MSRKVRVAPPGLHAEKRKRTRGLKRPQACVCADARSGPGPVGIVNEHLREFLEITLPATKPGKKAKYQLGVAEPKLGSAILEALSIRCVSNEVTSELFRGIRRHLDKLIQQFKEGDLAKAQLGLGHSFSRAKASGGPRACDPVSLPSQADR